LRRDIAISPYEVHWRYTSRLVAGATPDTGDWRLQSGPCASQAGARVRAHWRGLGFRLGIARIAGAALAGGRKWP